MATVFPGGTLLEATHVSDSSTGELAAYTFYTVPANRFALVTFHQATFTVASKNYADLDIGVFQLGSMFGFPSGINVNYNSSGSMGGGFGDGVGWSSEQTYLLKSGETVRDNTASGAGGIDVRFQVLEYANVS